MKIQVNSDKNIAVDAQVSGFVDAEVNRALKRFAGKLTRVEVHLSDVNSSKPGVRDKRCLIEARPAGHRPLSASNAAGTTEQAVKSTLTKLRSSLDTFFGKLGRAAPSRAKKKTVQPAPASAKKRRPAKKKTLSPRGPKKKGIYQARRKRWPRR